MRIVLQRREQFHLVEGLFVAEGDPIRDRHHGFFNEEFFGPLDEVALHCWRQTLPLRRSVDPIQVQRAPRQDDRYCQCQAFPLRESVVPDEKVAERFRCQLGPTVAWLFRYSETSVPLSEGIAALLQLAVAAAAFSRRSGVSRGDFADFGSHQCRCRLTTVDCCRVLEVAFCATLRSARQCADTTSIAFLLSVVLVPVSCKDDDDVDGTALALITCTP